jgi:hypothetical protein
MDTLAQWSILHGTIHDVPTSTGDERYERGSAAVTREYQFMKNQEYDVLMVVWKNVGIK